MNILIIIFIMMVTLAFFKMFINLHDTFENQDLKFFKTNSKRFIKESNYI